MSIGDSITGFLVSNWFSVNIIIGSTIGSTSGSISITSSSVNSISVI